MIEAHKYAERLHNVNVKTRVEWVPSHSDIKYNEIVDQLVKEVITLTSNIENTEYVSYVRRNT